MADIRKNILLFKIDSFLGGIWPLSSLAIVYFEQITHSYALAMLVWSIANLTQTFSEIPTGIYSDKIGRRKTLLLSAVMMTLCFVLWATAGQFALPFLLFIGAVFWGLADALLSGTDEALMYETMAELNQKENFSVLFAKSNFWTQCGLAVSALSAAVLVYFCSLQTLAWVSILPSSGGLITALLFVEPVRTRQQKRTTSWTHFLIAFRRLWRNKRLRFYAATAIVDEAVGMAFFRIEAAYYNTLIKKWVINIVRFLKQLSGMAGYALAPVLKRFGSVRLFFTAISLNEVVRLVALLLDNTLSPFIMSIRNLFWGISNTSQADILQQEFSDDQRATMKSIISLLKGILAAVAMYLFGVLADLSGPKMTVVAAMCIKVIVIVAALTILHHRKKART